MIGRAEIQRLSRAGGVDERTQERDYVVAWLLAGVSTKDFGLVFKGGTCLRRCYVQGYRYSEDLDFTLGPTSAPFELVDAVSAWCRSIEQEAGIRADGAADESNPSKRAWVSFTGPLAARREKAIKVDVADDEEVLDEFPRQQLLSEYSDLPDRLYGIAAYSLAEIWAEKARSLMHRAEPRDVYDMWFLAGEHHQLPASAAHIFQRKARAKGLDPATFAARLDGREVTLRRLWDGRLRDQVASVPDFDATWRAVRRVLRQAGYI
jgi:hypothetical protein